MSSAANVEIVRDHLMAAVAATSVRQALMTVFDAPNKNQLSALNRFVRGQATFPDVLGPIERFLPDDLGEPSAKVRSVSRRTMDNLVLNFERVKISNISYVYIYIDMRVAKTLPVSFDDFIGSIFYIGEGIDERILHSTTVDKSKDNLMTACDRHFFQNGKDIYHRMKVFEGFSKAAVLEMEREMIQYLVTNNLKHIFNIGHNCPNKYTKKCLFNANGGKRAHDVTASEIERYAGKGLDLLKSAFERFDERVFQVLDDHNN